MLVVSDSSPLNFLIRMGKAELLERLFGAVVIPPTVREELSRQETPINVRAFIEKPPAWLICKAPSHIDASAKLDPGEAAAISLAIELRANLILLDDGDARKAATARGLAVIGLLGILERADTAGLIDLPSAAAQLPSDYRIAQPLVDAAVVRALQRRRFPETRKTPEE